MRVRSARILVLYYLLGVFLAFVLIGIVVIRIDGKKKEIFIQSNSIQLEESFQLVISQEKNRLYQAVFDYTFWDEIVNATIKNDGKWYLENLKPMISTYKVDIVWLIDNDGIIKYTTNNNYKSLNSFFVTKEFLDSLRKARLLDTYVNCPEGVMMVQGGTIHPTADPKRLTDPQGYLIIGKLIDYQFITNVAKITGTKVALTYIGQLDSVVTHKNSFKINVPITDYKNTTLGHFKVFKNFDYLKQYTRFSSILILLFLFAIVSFVATLIYITTRWITKPLRIVEEVLVNNDLNKATSLKKFGSEYNDIGNLIVSFMNQKTDLEILKNKAQESDRLKSAFLANMSHEIRTPLNGILGFSELLTKENINTEDTKTYKKIIKNCSNDLLRIINDILDFSKIEAGQLTIEEQEINVYKFIEDVYEQYANKRTYIALKGIDFKINLNGSQIYIVADRQRLKQVMVNLIDNAIKFTEKGCIVFGYNVVDNKCVFSVVDTGIGIPDEQQESIFERFHQVNIGDSKVYGGTGLGLSICKGLIKLMNGRIWVESKKNEGSTFFVSFPVSKHSNTFIKKEENLNLLNNPSWKGKRLLLFEDNQVSSLLVLEYLSQTEIEIVSFKDAVSGLNYVETHPFDIILMDIRLNGVMSGLEATKIIRMNHPSVPIIAQTAYAMDSDYTKAIESGCNDYITKPYDSNKLIQILMMYLGSSDS